MPTFSDRLYIGEWLSPRHHQYPLNLQPFHLIWILIYPQNFNQTISSTFMSFQMSSEFKCLFESSRAEMTAFHTIFTNSSPLVWFHMSLKTDFEFEAFAAKFAFEAKIASIKHFLYWKIVRNVTSMEHHVMIEIFRRSKFHSTHVAFGFQFRILVDWINRYTFKGAFPYYSIITLKNQPRWVSSCAFMLVSNIVFPHTSHSTFFCLPENNYNFTNKNIH